MTILNDHIVNRREVKRIRNNLPNKIPKIFHHVWPGLDPMPEIFKYYIQTWKDNHPDWEFMFWTPKNLFKLQNQKWYDLEEVYAGKSDIARYEILQKFGGIYIDVDMECYKPIYEILNGVEFFVTYEQDNYLVPTIMGCTPKHPLINKIIQHIPESYKKNPNSTNITMKTGPKFISSLLDYDDPKLTIYPRYYFQPTLYFEEDNMSHEYPDSYGIHHFNGRKKGGWFYNLINE
jgi:mannosyltransferase OCH1-like enzyme